LVGSSSGARDGTAALEAEIAPYPDLSTEVITNFVLRLTNVRKAELLRPLEQAERLHPLDQRTLEFFIGHRIKLARRADFNILYPFAGKNRLSLYRRVRSAELINLHGSVGGPSRNHRSTIRR
jgi:hypothetical protein